MEGYTATDDTGLVFQPCPFADACDATAAGETGNCADGYTGVACSKCESGFQRSAGFECLPCADNMAWSVTAVVMGPFW